MAIDDQGVLYLGETGAIHKAAGEVGVQRALTVLKNVRAELLGTKA